MLSLLLILLPQADVTPPWILAHAYKLPSQYTNQESGYFALVAGLNDRLYIGAAKYGVNAYLLEFDPRSDTTKLVLDAHELLGIKATGFAAQAKFHTRGNVGESGKIYHGTKQGYPEKDEKRSDYPGGYVLVYDPKTGKSESFGMPKAGHGVISVTPDEKRGLAYISTCSDDRPIDHTHFMMLDLKTKKYIDFGNMEHAYAFIVVDHLGRAYHPIRGGMVARSDPATKKVTRLPLSVDEKPAGKPFTSDHCILNWDISPDRKTLWGVEMTTNALFRYDLSGDTLTARTVGPLLDPGPKGRTDCRAMCVGPEGTVWAAVTVHGVPDGPRLHLVRYAAGDKTPRDLGRIGVANPGFTTFTDDKGKPKPWHHTMPKTKDGTLSPWQPMGVAETRDGSVWVKTIAPYSLLKIKKEQAWK